MRRRLVTLLAAVGVSMTLAGPAAHAAAPEVPKTESVVITAACREALTPTNNATHAFSKARITSPCGGQAFVYLQRLRAWGWESENSDSFNGPGTKEISWRCDGVGTYTYRTLLQWRDGAGIPRSDISSERRFSC